MQELRIIHNKVSPTNIFYLLTSASDGTSTQVTAPRNDSDSTSLVISREKVIIEIPSNDALLASLNRNNTLDLKYLHSIMRGSGADEDLSASSKSSMFQIERSSGVSGTSSLKSKSETKSNNEDIGLDVVPSETPLSALGTPLLSLINQLSRNGILVV
jgi:hypothetical protein